LPCSRVCPTTFLLVLPYLIHQAFIASQTIVHSKDVVNWLKFLMTEMPCVWEKRQGRPAPGIRHEAQFLAGNSVMYFGRPLNITGFSSLRLLSTRKSLLNRRQSKVAHDIVTTHNQDITVTVYDKNIAYMITVHMSSQTTIA
jgi:hypothetical protein